MDALSILSVMIIGLALAVFGLRNYKWSLYAYMAQAVVLVLIFITLALGHDASELSIWVVTAIMTKVLFVPYVINKLLNRLDVVNEDEPVAGFFVSPIIALGFSLAIAMSIYPIYLKFSLIQEHIPLIAAITVFMIGIFGFILRRSVVKQIFAFCTFENGIHLTLALTAYNAPGVVEIGILTDAIFAVIIMSILATRFYKYFGSLDVDNASSLKG